MTHLSFPGPFIAEIAPEAARRLQVGRLSLLRDVPTYSYVGEGPIPVNPNNIDRDDVTDPWWSGGGSGVLIEQAPGATFGATFYKLSASGKNSRSSSPHEGESNPMPSQAPSFVSVQECADINSILDGLEGLDDERLAEAMTAAVEMP